MSRFDGTVNAKFKRRSPCLIAVHVFVTHSKCICNLQMGDKLKKNTNKLVEKQQMKITSRKAQRVTEWSESQMM